MAEYIEREAFYRFLTEQKDRETGAYSKGRNAGLDVARSALHNRGITPAADVVSKAAFDQVVWERDTAMEQLKEHGIPFGGKANVVAVGNCEGCMYSHRKRPQKCSCCRRNPDMKDCYEEG